MRHEELMQLALEQAALSMGQTSPNPLVGAALVKNGMLVATGHHKGPGHDHAELAAIKKAKEQGIDITGASLYCNLEPCCHTEKRTAPCAQRIIKEKLGHVYISHLDPNPQVSGKGVQLLKEAGIQVHIGLLEEQAKKLNESFIINMEENRPMVHLKWAQTLDGFVAQLDGQSKWITGEKAREDTHRDRLKYDAVLVGANTLREDNPSLTIRLCENPFHKVAKRLVLSSSGILPLDSKLFCDQHIDKTLVIIPEEVETEETKELENMGVTLHRVPSLDGKIDLRAMVKSLENFDIYSLYVEGGASVLSAFFKERLFDRISAYIAPKLLGTGKAALSELSLSISEQKFLDDMNWQLLGADMKFSAKRAKESE